MAKLRIYQLAKELGVSNKEVLDRTAELGIPGKTSHSNSLEPDEADQIRRAVLRQAFGASDSAERQGDKTRVIDGAAGKVVERRRGNIIRRRKQTKGGRSSAAEEVEEEAPGTESVDMEAANVAVPAADLSGEEDAARVGEVSLEPREEGTVEQTENLNEGSDQDAAAESAVQETVADGNAAEKKTEKKDEEAGPRVLGKIELPTERPKPTKTASRKTDRSRSAVTESRELDADDLEDDEGGKDRRGGRSKPSKRKKSRKREFTRGQLVDYENVRFSKRGKGGAKGGRDSHDEVETDEILATEKTVPKASKRNIKIDEVITVGELARQMSLKSGELIAKLMELGIMATINQVLDVDTAQIVSEEFGFTVELISSDEDLMVEEDQKLDPADLVSRPPVITVMGHVDHGKTSLLDAIRETSVVSREHGGITQHIGAYSVTLKDGRTITFLDTPGHEAFTQMRARGAHVTDIVILVVAADDGVMPQTVEAINHAKAAGVGIIVAVNKMDKPGASPDRVTQQLVEHGLQPEDWGGDTLYCHVSALQKEGIDGLLESVMLVAEMKELKGNPTARCRGTVIEARQDRGRGLVATVLLQQGTLKVGDIFVAGSVSGRVRTMMSDQGDRLEQAGISIPVELTGFSDAPESGDDFFVVDSEPQARQIALRRAEKKQLKEQAALTVGALSLEDFAKRASEMKVPELNVILKADVQGSVEAVKDSLDKLSGEKVRVKLIHSAVGGVSESDVQLALASKAIIIGFNVRAEPRAASDAEAAGVQVRFYRVIYELIDDIKLAMEGLLDPLKKENVTGHAEVRETFRMPRIGTVAGCYIQDGHVRRGCMLRLLRDSSIVFEGPISSLRRFKDDVREVQTGFECGIGIEAFNDIKVGDVIEAYEIEEVRQTLE